MVASEIDEIQSVRDVLAQQWARWARQEIMPQGYAGETVEYMLMRFGCQPPKATGQRPANTNSAAEEIEAVINSMPKYLRKFIIAEFVLHDEDGKRVGPAERAKATHASIPQYYKELRAALWWLHGNGTITRFI